MLRPSVATMICSRPKTGSGLAPPPPGALGAREGASDSSPGLDTVPFVDDLAVDMADKRLLLGEARELVSERGDRLGEDGWLAGHVVVSQPSHKAVPVREGPSARVEDGGCHVRCEDGATSMELDATVRRRTLQRCSATQVQMGRKIRMQRAGCDHQTYAVCDG